MNNNTIEISQTKQSPIGIIPVDWHIKPVGEAFRICNNLRLPISQDERNKIKGEYPYYGPTKIQGYIDNYRIEGKYTLIGEDGDHFLKWKDLQMTLLVEGKFNVNNHAHIIQGIENLTEWFFYYFNHKELTPYLTRQGVGRYKLTKDSLSKIPCLLPPIKEQQKITEILSTWDKAIVNCKKTIKNLKQRSKGLSQQLLTGKIRIVGFEETKWEYVTLNKIGEIPNKIPIDNADNLRLLTVRLYSKGIDFNDTAKPIISKSGRPYYARFEGEILIGRQNIHNGGIGLVEKIHNGNICSNAITSFSVNDKKYSKRFIFLYLSNPIKYKKIENYMGGTGQKELSEKQFLKLEIKLPYIKEQEAIASILDTANAELRLYEQKLQALQLQKKGLMQQLLTGKVRVKTNN
jgi:type I restriction enzyme S subunit